MSAPIRTIELEVLCEATVRETWRMDVPSNLAGGALVEYVREHFHDRDAPIEWMSDDVEGNERDRDVVVVDSLYVAEAGGV